MPGIHNDPYYVGVPELTRRVETERRLTSERSGLELRVRTWNESPGSPREEAGLRGAVSRHNDAIRAYNRSVDTYVPSTGSTYDRIFRTPMHR